MDAYLIVKTLHIVSATVLFGPGIGIAFFMFRAWYTPTIEEKRFGVATTVLADTLFTLPAVLLQGLTGIALVQMGGYEWSEGWLVAALGLFGVSVMCWLGAVWLQLMLRSAVSAAAASGQPIQASAARLFRIWFILGWPAFFGFLAIFALMVAKPQ